MDSHQVYLQQAEECERQAAACLGEENRKILRETARRWRKLAAGVASGKKDEPASEARAALSGDHPESP